MFYSLQHRLYIFSYIDVAISNNKHLTEQFINRLLVVLHTYNVTAMHVRLIVFTIQYSSRKLKYFTFIPRGPSSPDFPTPPVAPWKTEIVKYISPLCKKFIDL